MRAPRTTVTPDVAAAARGPLLVLRCKILALIRIRGAPRIVAVFTTVALAAPDSAAFTFVTLPPPMEAAGVGRGGGGGGGRA